MSAVMSAVNPMAAEGKQTVMDVLKRDQENFFRLVDDPANWNLQTRCTEWEVRDLVGHMIDVTEGYLGRWEVARKGESADALGTGVMGEKLNEHALEFRSLSREDALARLKADKERMMAIFEALTPEEWTSSMVVHPYMGPCPMGFFPAFHIMDYGIHPYDIEYGLGDKLAEIDEASAGILIPYCHIIMKYTVDQDSAKGVDCVYGIEVSGQWGGKWRATVRDGAWDAQPEDGDFEGCEAVFRYTPSDFVLTSFGRFPGGSATGDPEVIDKVRHLFFRF
ncbi:MAG: hypothetical protein QOK05_1540 [Chloroflexota bacterium]|jgi:uncharacterized protein (TIGR03083 family)|nr:hypothetical protein [Chloroflexota bacterium]